MKPLNLKQPTPIGLLLGMVRMHYHKLEALGPEGVKAAKGLYVATGVMWGVVKIDDSYIADRDRLIVGLINLAPSNKQVTAQLEKQVKKRRGH